MERRWIAEEYLIGALILIQVGFVVGLIVGQLLAAHSAG